MDNLNLLLSGYAIVDDLIKRTSSTAYRIGHDLIIGSSVEIWTGLLKTGTKLTLTTDYTLTDQNTYYSGATQANTPIWTKIAIVNGAYQNMNLYVTYTTIGDLMSVENTLEIVKTDQPVRRIDVVYTDASAHTYTPDAGLPDGTEVSICVPYSSALAITFAAPSVETAEGAATFITHGSKQTAAINNSQVVMKKVGTDWKFVSGVVSGDGLSGSNPCFYQKFPDRKMFQTMEQFKTNLAMTTASSPLYRSAEQAAVNWLIPFVACKNIRPSIRQISTNLIFMNATTSNSDTATPTWYASTTASLTQTLVAQFEGWGTY
jgi:hypothetical protein